MHIVVGYLFKKAASLRGSAFRRCSSHPFTCWLVFTGGLLVALACVAAQARAFEPADADTAFNAYNNAFYAANGGNAYYKPSTADSSNSGFWTLAEEIEMAEDAYDRTNASGTQAIVTALCNGFIAKNGSSWTWNEYNDDIEWACIAMCRAYLATGNTTFRNCAKSNFDAVWTRGWSTSLGGGIFWRTRNDSKNACSNGPAIIVCCYLAQILGDSSYLTKAQQVYTWERSKLFNASTGGVVDNVDTNGNFTYWYFTYNQGTFIGGANALYKATGTVSYLQDALLATNYTRSSLCNGNGIFPVSTDDGGDGATFNGIGLRWIARFVSDQKLWVNYYPWLKANADAAWSVRRTSDNLSWSDWTTATATGTRYSNGCAGSVVALQVVPALDPSVYFLLVNRNSGKSLTLAGGSTADGASCNQGNYDYGSVNQRWALLPTEGGSHFKLISWVTGKSVSITGDSTADEAQVQSRNYAGNNSAQQWDLVDAGSGWFKVKNVNSGKLLEVNQASMAENAKIQQRADTGRAEQLWRLQPQGDYYVRGASGRYISVQNGGSGNASAVVQYDYQSAAWYQWRFVNVGDGNYKVSSLNALSRCLCVANGSSALAANCYLYDYNSNNVGDQQVRLKPLTNGKFKFYFVHDGLTWDVPGGNTANNTPLQQYSDNSYAWQQFSLERFPGNSSAAFVTSANTAVFTVGTANTFGVTSVGSPTPSLNFSGNLPSGLLFLSDGNGTLTLRGNPGSGSSSSYPLTLTAHNGVGSDDVQSFVLVINRPPVPGSASVGILQNTSAQIPLTDLLRGANDPDGDALFVPASSTASAQGGKVALSGGTITYTPAAGFLGSDSFTYTLSDGRGGIVTGTVSVTVSPAGVYSVGAASVSRSSNSSTVVYRGLPGANYQPQYTDSLTNGVWLDDGPPLTADSNGQFTYQDATTPLPAQRFYRLRYTSQ